MRDKSITTRMTEQVKKSGKTIDKIERKVEKEKIEKIRKDLKEKNVNPELLRALKKRNAQVIDRRVKAREGITR